MLPLRIALFGPESTGKTQLAERLAVRYGEPWVPEYVREFWERQHGHIVGADLGEIARGQIQREDALAREAKRLLFCDTELLTNVLWADLLFPGECPLWVRAEADERSRRYACYLLCVTDVPFEPDPQRVFSTEAERAACMERWRHTLTSRRLPFAEVTGTGDDRFARACSVVESILKSV